MTTSKKRLGRLRAAAYAGKGEDAVRALVVDGVSDDALQLSGDGLLRRSPRTRTARRS
jgi:hypothetical protein